MPPPRPIEALTEAVGLTPAARLRRHPLVVVKLESSAPEATLHDRAARALVAAGLPDGPLRLGGDGELAVALARELARLRRPLSVVLPEDVTLETAQSLEAWGAQVTRSPFAEGVEGAERRAGSDLAPALALAWRAAGAELARELPPGVSQLVVADHSQALLDGLADARANLALTAVQPEKLPSRLHGVRQGPVARAQVERVGDEAAWAERTRLGKEEGLLVSLASAAAVSVAVARAAHTGREVWCVVSSTGERSFTLAEQF